MNKIRFKNECSLTYPPFITMRAVLDHHRVCNQAVQTVVQSYAYDIAYISIEHSDIVLIERSSSRVGTNQPSTYEIPANAIKL